jgi:HAD superfamily hydrolase (TIGR01509 family)
MKVYTYITSMNESPHPPVPAGIVFDCDGLLVDTETLWTRAETELFRRHGRGFTLDDKKALLGTGWVAGGRVLERLLDRPGDAEELAETLLALVTAEVEAGVEPLPGAIELVSELRGRVPLGVASNSPRPFVEGVLERGGLDPGAFDAMVTGEELDHPKPAPDIYVEACRRLGVEPAAAVALEDSPLGVASARAAGLYVIGIPSLPGVDLEADLVAESLFDPRVRSALGA